MLREGVSLRDYEICSVIGQGGFGIVYRGRHQELDIDVAIKEYFPQELSVRQEGRILPSKPALQASFEDGLTRFLNEAKQLERFRMCPNIVTCRDLFRANGTAYTVMEYITGLPLSTLLEKRESRGEPLTEEELLELILPLLRGLQTVHESGVFHRDIKPSNILVRREDAAPILIDFGAAKYEVSKHTKSFAPYTDGYAALEQVGEGEIGPWTDIYGLGAVMWRIIAGGNPPFVPPNPLNIQKRAFALMNGQADPMPSTRELGKGRFSEKVLKAVDECLVPNVNSRVQNCGELLGRLGKASTGGSEVLRPPAVLGKEVEHSSSLPRRGRKNPAVEKSEEIQRWEVPALVGKNVMAISPGMRLLAVRRGKHVNVWDLRSGTIKCRFSKCATVVTAIAFSDDETMIAVAGRNTAKVWELSSGNIMCTVQHFVGTGLSLAFSRDKNLVALGTSKGEIILWDVSSNGLRSRSAEHKEDWGCTGVTAVAFSPSGERLISGTFSGNVRVGRVTTGHQMTRIEKHKARCVVGVAFQDNDRVVVATSDKIVRVVNVRSMLEVKTVKMPSTWSLGLLRTAGGVVTVEASSNVISGRDLEGSLKFDVSLGDVLQPCRTGGARASRRTFWTFFVVVPVTFPFFMTGTGFGAVALTWCFWFAFTCYLVYYHPGRNS